jgi:hypothetical protein
VYLVMLAKRVVLVGLENRCRLANGMLTQDDKILVEAVAEENLHIKPTLAARDQLLSVIRFSNNHK